MLRVGLEQKVVVVTGAAAGIGWGIARVCAEWGATVVLADINDASGRAESLCAQGTESIYLPLDVSDAGAIEPFMEEVAGRFGRIDGLVNNAGVTIEGDFLDFDLGNLERLWQVNQRSVFLMCQAAARLMEPGSAIVNIASNHAGASVAGYEMYAATKGAIVAMTRAMAWSLGDRGIRVNSLCPGLTKTEAVAKVAEENPSLAKSFNKMHADNQYNTVEEVGYISAFLLSGCSGALTGSNITADHGLSASLCPTDDLK
ncbi:3-oxoacyl-[acyl-carrier protein] reductase [Microbulbifer thermotolerans]|uniref:SDR family oxidoreductase n=1 Tax=Microbulbifer thermotolerans TaxID=252514 RepID=UPI0008E15238|nr:SDR family oxidoreductase [Microbulbifer thermotolerans]MCX2835817.1 SDR family oxidoreductase [Microbulbifer thermotolerans]SFC76410.1 3-oxoacyl-[acyl-carrier protein] reductase [Microbulbifer thermotolerans]